MAGDYTGSFINELLERMGPIDLHIVAVQRYPELLEQSHEQGFSAYLVKEGDRHILMDEPDRDEAMKGFSFVSSIQISIPACSKSSATVKRNI